MAEPLIAEFSIQGIQEATSQIEDLEGAIGDADEASSDWGSTLSSLRSSITAGVAAVTSIAGAVADLVSKLAEMGAEWERQAGIIGAFSGDISIASQRVNGLITDLDLMVQQNRLTQAGIQLTAEDFATLAVRATEVAQATGEDAATEFERLTQTLVSGSAEGLRPYGVQLGKTTTLAELQAAAVAALTDGHEESEAQVRTLGGVFGQAENSIANMTAALIDSIEKHEVFGGLVPQVSSALDEMTESVTGLENGLTGADRFVIGLTSSASALGTMLTQLAQIATAAGESFVALVTGDADALAASTRQVDALIENWISLGDAFDRAAVLGAEGTRARRAEEEAETSKIMEQTQALAENARVRGSRRSISGAEDQAQSDPLADMGIGLFEGLDQGASVDELIKQEAELLRIEEERVRAETERASLFAQATKAKMEALEQERAEADADRERRAAQIRQLDEYAAKQRETQSAIVEGSRGVQQLLASGVEMLIEGNDNLGASFAEMLKNWLKTFAVQQAMLGAAAIAEAIGMAVTNTAGAATKLASAAKHFALAAVAGGASAAIPAGGASTSGVAGGSSGGGGASSGTGGGGGGSVVININSPVAEPLIGRTQERARVAAERRFGSG